MTTALFLEVILLGIILSADSFSAAVAMGTRRFTFKDALKFAASSGSAEGIVALIGFWAGANVLSYISSFDHWIAFFILLAVAIHMGIEGLQGLRKQTQEETAPKFHSFTKVIIVSFVTSLDALGVGIGLGVADKQIAPFIISISLFAFIATLTGLYLARQLSSKFGPIFTLLGAVILTFMATELLKI